MSEGGLEISVTNMRDFAAVLWSRIDGGREWDTKINDAIRLLTGDDAEGSKSDEGRETGADGVATIGTVEGVEYNGTRVGKYQKESIPALVAYLKSARQSIKDAAKGAAVITEEFHGQDGANAKATEQTYQGFGEATPHGLYPGQM